MKDSVKWCKGGRKAHLASALSRRAGPRQRGSDLHTRRMAKAKKTPAGTVVSMTTAEATVDAMLRHGIDTIYALPGVQNDELFAALFKAQDRMRTVHTRQDRK